MVARMFALTFCDRRISITAYRSPHIDDRCGLKK